MDYLIFPAVTAACLGIGGHQQSFFQLRPLPDKAEGVYYLEPPHPTSLDVSQICHRPGDTPHSVPCPAHFPRGVG
ncbi:hypothetical protein DSO57_1008392 [Entomophthora muscae]|uniref:Uncharacterized protein n=1 Tax=Entomophthora muscae TaxID=34485 RepID=A0ACC2TU54_9FUNG|nr:hypothetical protein DSO57_1008392 [Entomophthora muscae]